MGKNKGILLWAFSLLCVSVRLSSQSQELYQSSHYGVENGLTDKVVYSTLRDSSGLLWLVTSQGIVRFDGSVFTTVSRYRETMPGGKLQAARFVGKNSIVLTFPALSTCFYHYQLHANQVATREICFNNSKYKLKGLGKHFYVSGDNRIFASTFQLDTLRIYEYHPSADQFELYLKLPLGLPRGVSWSGSKMLTLQDGRFVFYFPKYGLFCSTKSKAGFDKLVFNQQQLDERSNVETLQFIDEVQPGTLWFSAPYSKEVLEARLNNMPASLRRVSVLPPGIRYKKIWKDSKGRILVGGDQSLTNIFTNLINTAILLEPDSNQKQGWKVLPSQQLKYAEGPIWDVHATDFMQTTYIARETGLSMVYHTPKRAESFLRTDLSPGQFGVITRGMCEDTKGNVYISTEGNGWFVVPPGSSTQLKSIQLLDTETGKVLKPTCSMNLVYDKKRNCIWGYTCQYFGRNSGIVAYYPGSRKTRIFEFPNKITALTMSSTGVLWVASMDDDNYANLSSFNPDRVGNQKITSFKSQLPTSNLESKSILKLHFLEPHTLVAGIQNQLLFFDCSKQKLVNVKTVGDKGYIYEINHQAPDTLWVGTEAGLLRFTNGLRDSIFWNKKSGLPSDQVCSWLPATQPGCFWVGTYTGLAYYDQEASRFFHFSEKDGLANNELNRHSRWLHSDGRLFIGTINGFSIITPKTFLPKPLDSKVAITRMKKLSRSQNTLTNYEFYRSTNEINIEAKDLFFELEFALPAFEQPALNRYEVKLEGYDEQWVDIGSNTFIRYYSLPPGRYTFCVKAYDHQGNYTPGYTTASLVVKRPFHRTWWFVSLCGLAIAAFVYFFVTRRLKHRLELERLRVQIASDLHDEVSGMLSGIAMQADMLGVVSQEEKSRQKAKGIAENSRKAMVKLNDVIWSYDTRRDSFQELINRLQEYAQELLEPLDIHFTMDIFNIDLQKIVPIAIKQNLYLIAKEGISNVAKHANASRVNLAMWNEGDRFYLRLKDDGDKLKHLDELKSQVGNGLANIEMRANRLHATLRFEISKGLIMLVSMKKFI